MKNTVGLAIIGLVFGLLIVVFATLVALFTTETQITLENIITIQLTTPLLWIIDTFPIFLAVILGMLGSREDRLQRVLREGRIAHKRATDFQQLNVELTEQAEEHQELEAIISQGKKEWEGTFDSVEDMILITDEAGIINRCNRATTRTFQKDFLQIIGKQVDGLFFGDNASERERLPVDKMEMRLPTLPGWYEVSSSSLVYEGTRQGRIYIVRNVTERKQASLDMQRQKQFYETLVKNSPFAIVTLSLDHRVVACNPAFEDLFGFHQSEILGQDLDNLISPTDLVEETHSLTELVKGGEVVHKITRRITKDGSTIDVEIFGIPVVLWGKQIGIFGLYHDVTELVRAQEEVTAAEITDEWLLEELQEEAEEVVIDEEAVPVPETPKAPSIKVETIEGVGPTYANKLAEVEIVTTNDLLDAAASRKGRQDLADNTGISGKLILKWVNRADLMRVPGVGEEYSDLLEAAGVDTIKELRNRNPEHLFQALLEVNEQKSLVRRVPHQSEVEAWVQDAKDIDPLLTY
jgi:PAS domain S-box-containing protein